MKCHNILLINKICCYVVWRARTLVDFVGSGRKHKNQEFSTLQETDMDSRSAPCRSGSTTVPIRDEIISFDNLRESAAGKLNLENWMVLSSQQNLHIFSVNKKLNGNLAIRNTICIGVDLVVKVFGENNDDTLFSLQLLTWSQLQNLTEKLGAHVKREVDLEFVDVVVKAASSDTNICEGEDQKTDTLAIKFEIPDPHESLTEVIEHAILESVELQYNSSFVSKSSYFNEVPLTFAENGDQNRITRQSQICSICSESYVIGEMDRHMRQHFTGEFYQCNVCGRKYRSLVGLHKHMKSNHVGGRDEFFCDICKGSRDYQSKANIEEHMKNKHFKALIMEQDMKCSTCGKIFFTPKQFTDHVKRHDKSKWKSCPICHKSYDNVNRHMNDKHFNIRNYVCDICGSAYKQATTLKEHVEVRHTSDADFFCDICRDGKGYRSKGYLKKHFAKVHANKGDQRRENTESFYECNVCNKTFTLKSSLVVHAKLHTGKVHICHVCGQSFNHPNYLRKHFNRHKTIKKRKCTMCEKEYVQNVDLRLHMKKVHGVIVPIKNKH